MKLWGNYPHLAVFPGALILDDGRSSDRNYPSSSLTQSQLSVEEPALSDGACQAGARLYLQEGYAYPGPAVAYFMQEAQKHGAELLSKHPVQSLAPADLRKTVKGVVSNGEHYKADVVVLAAALGIPELVKPLGLSVPLTAKPRTVTVITKPMKRLLKHIVVTDQIFIVQRRDGDVMISLYAGDDRPEEATPEVAKQVIKAAAQLVPELAKAECDQITAGLMPYPVDAHPIVGFTKECTNLYIAVMHSGATLAPLMGKLIADEIVNRKEEAVLAPYRLQRDFSDLRNVY
ncbi:hypothetical protein ABBQ32_008554 [Trebouxia sp. C0010 RCD-2024]